VSVCCTGYIGIYCHFRRAANPISHIRSRVYAQSRVYYGMIPRAKQAAILWQILWFNFRSVKPQPWWENGGNCLRVKAGHSGLGTNEGSAFLGDLNVFWSGVQIWTSLKRLKHVSSELHVITHADPLRTPSSVWHSNVIVCGRVIDVYSWIAKLFPPNVSDSSMVMKVLRHAWVDSRVIALDGQVSWTSYFFVSYLL